MLGLRFGALCIGFGSALLLTDVSAGSCYKA